MPPPPATDLVAAGAPTAFAKGTIINTSSSSRALVLAGAGAAGNAWQLGLVAGLREAGIDLTHADVIIGTSAGSTAAAQITTSDVAELYAATQVETPQAPGATARATSYMDWSQQIIDSSADAAEMRRRIAAAALERDSGGSERWHDIVAARLPGARWPEQRLLITALDAQTAEPVVFDRNSGVDLVDAVAASTSALTPYRVGGRSYLNGGYRRSSNADLAAGYDRVLVLDPFGGRSRTPVEWGLDLATQVDELRAEGGGVETVFPSADSGDVFNASAMDPSTRRQAARGGYDSGLALAGQLAEFWMP